MAGAPHVHSDPSPSGPAPVCSGPRASQVQQWWDCSCGTLLCTAIISSKLLQTMSLRALRGNSLAWGFLFTSSRSRTFGSSLMQWGPGLGTECSCCVHLLLFRRCERWIPVSSSNSILDLCLGKYICLPPPPMLRRYEVTWVHVYA